MGDVPGNDRKRIWNGGKTNKYNEMIRESEDYYDTIDSEVVFREELQEREQLMKEEAKHQQIQSKYRLSKKPLHELYTEIDYEEKTKVSLMGGKGGPVEAMKSKKGTK